MIQLSDKIGQLVEALRNAQKKFDPILKDTKNPLYNSKYATLASVIAATQPHLIEQGLILSQFPIHRDQQAGCITVLAHISGEYIVSELLIPAAGKGKEGVPRYDAQSACGAITYARRYAYEGALGVASENDDDGNSTVAPSGPRAVRTPPVSQKPATSGKPRPQTDLESKPQAAAASQASPQSNDSAATQASQPSELEAVKDSAGQPPDSKALAAYFERAKSLTADLTTAGLKANRGKTVGAKVKSYLLLVASAKDLPQITRGQWDTILTLLEQMVKSDPKKAVQTIEEKIK